MSLEAMVNERYAEGKVRSNTDLDGKEIATLSTEVCKKRFANHIFRIHSMTGKRITEVFWSFIDWAFWMTMWEVRYMYEKIQEIGVEGFEAQKFAPYDQEECKRNAFASRDFLLKENLGVSFGIMKNLWLQSVSLNNEDFLLGLTQMKEMNKNNKMLSKELGQFFTPPCLTDMMAKILGQPEERPCLVHEPCAGFGGMLISHWKENDGMNQPAGSFVYLAQEVERKTARACFLNMIVHQIPAKVVNMNSLSGEEYSPPWYTPLLVGSAIWGEYGEPEHGITITNPPFIKKFGLEWVSEQMGTEHVRRSFDGEQRSVL